MRHDGFDRLACWILPSPGIVSGYDPSSQASALATAGSANGNCTDSGDFEYYRYDAAGNRTSLRNRAGETIGFTYDALGRTTVKDLPGSELDVSYGYDLLGQMTSAAQPGDSLTFAWDALGRNVRQGGASGDYESHYDLAGRRTRIDHPDSFFVTQDYLVTGEMTKIRENGSALLATFDYDQLGRRERLTLGNGAVTNYDYDEVGRLWKLGHDLGGADTANDNLVTLTYNSASQIVGRHATNDAYAWTGHGNGSTASSFDGLNRLTSQTTGQSTTGFTHDARGNRLNDGLRSYTYDSENKTRGVAAAPWHYDPLGRLSGAGNSPGSPPIHNETRLIRVAQELRIGVSLH